MNTRMNLLKLIIFIIHIYRICFLPNSQYSSVFQEEIYMILLKHLDVVWQYSKYISYLESKFFPIINIFLFIKFSTVFIFSSLIFEKPREKKPEPDE